MYISDLCTLHSNKKINKKVIFKQQRSVHNEVFFPKKTTMNILVYVSQNPFDPVHFFLHTIPDTHVIQGIGSIHV